MGRQDWDWEKILSRLINNLSEKTYWDNIYELRRRGTEIVFDRLRELASQGNAKERMIAVDVLSQLDMPLSKEEYSKRVVDFFFLLLKKEENEDVQKSILFGLGHNNQHLNSNELISFISNFKNNKSVKIREGVVFAFLGLNNDLAIETLIQLSQDKLSRIRSWATFGIGSMVDRSDQLIIYW